MRAAILLALVLLTGLTFAEIPQVISYQGKVSDTSGNPVADGSYSMRFRIYDAVAAGTLLWDSGDQTVTMAAGVFSVLLGESPQPAITLDFTQDYWLDITVDADVQVPRVKMGSVGYAYMASGLVAGTEVTGAVEVAPFSAIKAVNTATAGGTYGGLFEDSSPDGVGVCGRAIATTGDAPGGHFSSSAPDGRGVIGLATATTGTVYGVYGESQSTDGRGVYGCASATTGITYGVHGQISSTDGRGVCGSANAASGFTYGVLGENYSTAGRGVQGMALATSGITFGVVGVSMSPSGYGVYYQGGIGGSGLMRVVVNTSLGPTGLDAVTAAGSWVEDFGEGQLVNGRCHLELDPVFLETVTIDAANPMKVFVQLRDECEGTCVKTGQASFDVVELHGGSSNAAFAYRVVAKRKGFETKRLDVCDAARSDSYLYPELEVKEQAEREASDVRREEERARMEGHEDVGSQ